MTHRPVPTSWWDHPSQGQKDRSPIVDVDPDASINHKIMYSLYTQDSPETMMCPIRLPQPTTHTVSPPQPKSQDRIPNYFGFWGQDLHSYLWSPSYAWAARNDNGDGSVNVCVQCKGNPYGIERIGVT